MTATEPNGRSILSPTLTPRENFHITRKLVGVDKWPLALLTVIYTINVSDQFLLPAMFPLLKREFGLSDTALGFLSGSYLVSVTLFTVPFGILADRYNRTRIIAWGTMAWGITMIFTGSAAGFPMLLIGRMLLGMWDPCDNPTSQSLLADYYPVNQRSKVMGIYQVGQLAGFILLPIAGIMAQAWGWRATFYFFALPAFVVSALAWRLPEPERGVQDRRHQRLEENEDTVSTSGIEEGSGLRAHADLLRCRSYVAMLASGMLGSLFFGGIGVWVPTFLIRYHDLEIAEAASAIAVVAVGGLIGAVASGNLADYLIQAKHPTARIALAGIARAASVPFFIIAFVVSYTEVALISLMAAAMFLVAGIPLTNAARADVLHPRLRGRGTSMDAVSQSLASAASPVIFGILSDALDLRTAFLILSPLSALSGLLLLTLGLATYGRDERAVREQVRREHFESLRATGKREDDNTELGENIELSLSEAVQLWSPDQGPMLEVQTLDFSYGQIQVLFGVDLIIPQGGCHALVGRNGVGKTTLLSSIGGLLDGQSGRIFYKGQELTGIPADQRTKLGITLMAAGRSTFPSLSVRDNLWFGSYPFTDNAALAQERGEAVLEVFPALKPRLDQRAGTLSGGEQQMVALGRALMAGPDLLLIDELSLGLAPTVTGQLLDVLDHVLEFGTTILLVEQSIGVAFSVADTVFFMDRGVVEPLGPAEGLDADELTRRLLERRE
ncbi:MFS transporter [Candidatus Poriferisocius sp.]|uniref:MFS transporter n=1 Tax=Candidatus Poriferisocius sp. TaxID=3101276 RepID=UPI003B5C9611